MARRRRRLPPLAALWPAPAAGLRECWEGFAFTYAWCCDNPPGAPKYNSMCWGGDTGNGRFTFDRCCDIRFGPKVRYLPAWWTDRLELEYRTGEEQSEGVRIVQLQRPADDANRTYSWDPRGVPTGPFRRFAPLYGIVWEDRTARVLLGTRMLKALRGSLGGRKLRVLDIATGLGLNAIAAARSGHVEWAVGIDPDAEGIVNAGKSARRNEAERARFLRFDVCQGPEALRSLLRERISPGLGLFDVVTMSGLHAPPSVIEGCVYRLLLALAGPRAMYFDADIAYFSRHRYYKYGKYPSFERYAAGQGRPALHVAHVDVASLHGTDEPAFLPILPVDVWALSGREGNASAAAAGRALRRLRRTVLEGPEGGISGRGRG